MTKIPKFVWVLVPILVVVLGIKQCMAGDVLRYKMTVTVEIPEGIKTGSAVREAVRSSEMRILPMQGGVTYNIGAGEAVVVDLGQRGVLFALLGDQHEAGNVFEMFSDKKNDRVVLTPEQYPLFVRFKDPKDPKTVEAVYRAEPYDARDGKGDYVGKKFHITDRFEEMFGAGVKLREVTIEMTDEPVTRGIAEKFMPSYAPQQEYLKWFSSLPYGDPRRININDFR